MLIIGCSKAQKLAKRVARKLKVEYSKLIVRKFPDNEIYVRFDKNIKNKDIVLIQSFYNNVNDALIETIFAAYTAKDLKAKNVTLVATYFPYFRQDKRFNYGEAVSIEVITKVLCKCLDKIIIINPHLHRKNSLKEVFNIKVKELSANGLIAEYIKKKFKNRVIVGPDRESYRWAERVARIINGDFVILKKKRISAYNVKLSFNKKIDLKNKDIVIVDDIVSTGTTLLKTIKFLRKHKVGRIDCICVHGIFVNNTLKKLEKYCRLISTNTIPNKRSKIDVTNLIAETLISKTI